MSLLLQGSSRNLSLEIASNDSLHILVIILLSIIFTLIIYCVCKCLAGDRAVEAVLVAELGSNNVRRPVDAVIVTDFGLDIAIYSLDGECVIGPIMDNVDNQNTV